MKKLKLSKLFILTLLMLTGSIFFTSCQNESIVNEEQANFDLKAKQLESDSKTISELFQKIKPELINQSKRLGEFEVITFEVVKNQKTNEITLENFNTVEFFPIMEKEDYMQMRGSYTVSCSGGSEGDWTESCGNKWSCGALVADCLEQGGCATVCQNERRASDIKYSSVKVTFVPKIN